jgi:hypothetical protein
MVIIEKATGAVIASHMDSVNLLDYFTDDYEIRQDLFPPHPWKRGGWKYINDAFVQTDEFTAELNAPRKEAILAELALIDVKSIRAIREGDSVRTAEWETKAAALRVELAAL